MNRLAWGFALVAFGHFVYFLGSLDPITVSTVSDLITSILLGIAAWRTREENRLPRSVLPILLALGPLEVIDYFRSFDSGWQTFHVGFTLVLVGAVVISVGAWRVRAGARGEPLVRIGAWLGAAGSLVYLVLAAEPFLFGGATFVPFLVGAGLALAGWALVALGAQASWPGGGSTNA